MSKNLKVVVAGNDLSRNALDLLEQYFTVVATKASGFVAEDAEQHARELTELVPGAAAILWVNKYPVTTQLLDAAGPQLKVIATPSAGYNHCNVPELRARGIKLSNTPEVLSAAVAEVAVSLMLAVARRFTEGLRQVNKGEWMVGFETALGLDLRGSTVGVIGLGGIGQATVKRLAAFEVSTFLYTGHREKPEARSLGAKFVSLDELLRSSDFILLACPLTDETKLMINATTLAKMKSNAIVVNVGRGDLIDQEALYTAVKERKIYGAGLDVTTPEPLPKDHPLLTLPNVFVLPHIGSATLRTRQDMGALAAQNIINALQGKPLVTPVLE